MKISDILQARQTRKPHQPIFSFEFFPPKTPKGEEALYRTVDELRDLHPDFVSVTYGAGGSTRAKTAEWVERIKREHGVETMAHLTCVGASRAELSATITDLSNRGIENILALRGDPPKGADHFEAPPDGLSHGNELVSFIRAHHSDLSVGVAGYPEKHPEAPDPITDLANLRRKVNAGADFVITQLFFENERYFDFVAKLHDDPLWTTPVIPGIMPITSKDQIDKFILMCGASIPGHLRESVVSASSDEEVIEIGVAFAIRQATELLDRGAPGIHFYTLNKSPSTRKILAALRARTSG